MPSSAAAMKSMDLDSEMDTPLRSSLLCAEKREVNSSTFVGHDCFYVGLLFLALSFPFINLPFHEVELKTGSALAHGEKEEHVFMIRRRHILEVESKKTKNWICT